MGKKPIHKTYDIEKYVKPNKSEMKQTSKSYMIQDFLWKRSARTPIQQTLGGMEINHIVFFYQFSFKR